MIELPYNLVIEETVESAGFSFSSPELPGFGGNGSTVEECIERAREGMVGHTAILAELRRPVPPQPPKTTVIIQRAEHTIVT